VTDGGVSYVVLVDVPTGGFTAFRQYENAVLALLADHAGRLERRIRSTHGHREVHILWFPDTRALDAFRADRRRAGHLLEASGARTELFAVEDIPGHASEPPASGHR
jgi:hypothetical protein